jgi:8-amino-7-oxononanoate synthase
VALGQLARSTRHRLGIQAESPEDSVPIIPVIVGEDARAVRWSETLAAAGFYVPVIRPPTVPEGTARLRISLSALHQPSMVEDLVAQFEALRSGPGYA